MDIVEEYFHESLKQRHVPPQSEFLELILQHESDRAQTFEKWLKADSHQDILDLIFRSFHEEFDSTRLINEIMNFVGDSDSEDVSNMGTSPINYLSE